MFMSQAKALLDEDDGHMKFNDIPVPDYERRRIEQRPLQKEDKTELSDFYVAETDEEREEKAPSYSASELAEIRCRAFQVLRRAPGVFSIKMGCLSDWFANRIPKDMDQWPQGHPMVFEVEACLRPIMIADVAITTEYLQEQMQARGAFMLRVAENPHPKLWDLVFYLDSRFYCNVTMDSGGHIPEIVQEFFEKERQKLLDAVRNKDDLTDPARRARLIQEQEEQNIVRGVITEQEEEEDAEEERLSKEERDAKDAAFKLGGCKVKIVKYRMYMQGI